MTSKKMTSKGSLLQLLFYFFSPLFLQAQSDQIWVMGNKAGINFTSGQPVAINSALNSSESSASVCDAYGQLLFYTDGYQIWNRKHNLMPGSRELTPYGQQGIIPTSSTSQGALIVPQPGQTDRYYVFSLTSKEVGNYMGRLYYSIVDMSQEQGMGAVPATKHALILDSGLIEKMTIVPGNHCDFWLLVCSQQEKFRAFHITTNGINPKSVSSLCGLGSEKMYVGQMAVSPDGLQLAATQTGASTVDFDEAVLFDFNPGTGIASNPMVVSKGKGAYGLCFSADSRKLYINTRDQIVQFDLSIKIPATVLASRTLVGTAYSHTGLKMAPDGKIYFQSGFEGIQSILGRLNRPEIAGKGCDYTAKAIILLAGTRMFIGLPHVLALPVMDTIRQIRKIPFACFAQKLLLLPVSGNSNYHWSNGYTGNQLEVTQAGRYWVSYRNNCKYYIDSFQVSVPGASLPAIKVQGSCSGVAEAMAWIEPGQSVKAYRNSTWEKDNVVLARGDTLAHILPGNYLLRLQTDDGCDTLLPVNIPSYNQSNKILSDSLICLGDSLTLSSYSQLPEQSYRWYCNDTLISAQAMATLPSRNAGINELMLVTISDHCSDTAYRKITVDAPGINLGFTLEAAAFCTGAALNITPKNTDTTHLSHIQWDWGDYTNYTAIQGPVSHAYATPGQYVIHMSRHFRACMALDFIDTVTIFSMPIVDLGPDTTICPNQPAYLLRNLATQSGRHSYSWSTGTSASELSVSKPGLYQLTVYSDQHCSATDIIEIKQDCYLDIPNVFTPNNDGHNDYFCPKPSFSGKITGFHLQLYNRSGKRLFETTDKDGRGWDGRFNQQLQPADAYVYIIELNLNNEYAQHYTGTVSLIR